MNLSANMSNARSTIHTSCKKKKAATATQRVTVVSCISNWSQRELRVHTDAFKEELQEKHENVFVFKIYEPTIHCHP